MDKDVIIYINGLQYAQTEDGSEPIEVITPGEYYFKNGNHYLMYDDADDEELTGSRNIIKFRDAYLEVTKRGARTTKLVFEKDKKTLSQYQTPFGTMNIGITTTQVSFKENSDSIELTAKYSMDINSGFIADCSVSVLAKSKKDNINILS